MAKSESKRITEIIVILIGIILYFIGIGYNINIYDEGIALVGADRISHGEIPYRDFWTMYTPLSYYINFVWMSLTGFTIISVRILSSVFAVGIALIIYLNLKRYLSKVYAYSAYFFSIILLCLAPFNSKPIGMALFMSAISIHLLIKAFSSENNKAKKINVAFVLSGLLGGMTLLTRQDIGIYLLASVTISAFLLWVIYIKSDRRIEELHTFSWRGILLYLTGFSVIVVPFIIVFLIKVPFAELYNQLYFVPFHIYPDYRSIHSFSVSSAVEEMKPVEIFRAIWFIIFRLTIAIPISTVIFMFDRKRLTELRLKTFYLLFFSVMSVFLFAQSSVRSDAEHTLPMVLFAVISFFLIAYDEKQKRIQTVVLALIGLFILSYPVVTRIKTLSEYVSSTKSTYIETSRAKGIRSPSEWAQNLDKAVTFIKSNTKPEDRIFVCTERNDKLVYNDVMFYFLAERLPAVKYHELHPGVTTEEKQQREMIESISKYNAKFVVRFTGNAGLEEPNKSSESSNVRLLDNYIDDNYFRVITYGDYWIFVRK